MTVEEVEVILSEYETAKRIEASILDKSIIMLNDAKEHFTIRNEEGSNSYTFDFDNWAHSLDACRNLLPIRVQEIVCTKKFTLEEIEAKAHQYKKESADKYSAVACELLLDVLATYTIPMPNCDDWLEDFANKAFAGEQLHALVIRLECFQKETARILGEQEAALFKLSDWYDGLEEDV